MVTHTHDEEAGLFIGCFSKSMPHDGSGKVHTDTYMTFQSLCKGLDEALKTSSQEPTECQDVFDNIEVTYTSYGSEVTVDWRGAVDAFNQLATGGEDTAEFVNPLAAAGCETHGPSSLDPALDLPPAPSINSSTAAAEMVELYWMALLRDVPLVELEAKARDWNGIDAIEEIKGAYQAALDADQSEARLKVAGNLADGEPSDLPGDAYGNLNINEKTIFGCGLPGEELGPRISQFFLRDIPFGVQRIDTAQVPYVADNDFLLTTDDWLSAQDTGKDKRERGYSKCNNYADQLAKLEIYYPEGLDRRHISTMRDQARFVNRDALHQAYFNAALYLDAIEAPVDPGNPYPSRYSRMEGFGTLAGPDLLTLVSEVASRALKAVWRQKWLVHRRGRPEVMGGMIELGTDGFILHEILGNSYALATIRDRSDTGAAYLPMAFSAGSPNHPAYGAGHASVAGACATILKAWFADGALHTLFSPKTLRDPGNLSGLLQPGRPLKGGTFDTPQPYAGPDFHQMTLFGEINKLASNIAMGRSMGGVHWRSDNTRSLRLGEQVAMHILQKRCQEYFEPDTSFSFTSFDNRPVTVSADVIDIG